MTNTQNDTAVWTFDEDIVSDLHKDAYGMRPSESWWYGWTHATDEYKQYQWNHLLEVVEASIKRDDEDKAWAIETFEKLVASTIEAGAKTREDALRWIMDASICDGDWDFLCYEHGLPYGYFKKAA